MKRARVQRRRAWKWGNPKPGYWRVTLESEACTSRLVVSVSRRERWLSVIQYALYRRSKNAPTWHVVWFSTKETWGTPSDARKLADKVLRHTRSVMT